MIELLRHGKVELVLHTLRDGAGPRLLLLHGLGERAPGELDADICTWPGAVHALDFTGHGESGLPRGGGYTAEMLAGDADAALQHLGPLTLCGRGLGAWVALILAGARPGDVRGAILCDGPGLRGGPPPPGKLLPLTRDASGAPPDPWALVELAGDWRPPGYALAWVRRATRDVDLAHPITVCAEERTGWLDAVAAHAAVARDSLPNALRRYTS